MIEEKVNEKARYFGIVNNQVNNLITKYSIGKLKTEQDYKQFWKQANHLLKKIDNSDLAQSQKEEIRNKLRDYISQIAQCEITEKKRVKEEKLATKKKSIETLIDSVMAEFLDEKGDYPKAKNRLYEAYHALLEFNKLASRDEREIYWFRWKEVRTMLTRIEKYQEPKLLEYKSKIQDLIQFSKDEHPTTVLDKVKALRGEIRESKLVNAGELYKNLRALEEETNKKIKENDRDAKELKEEKILRWLKDDVNPKRKDVMLKIEIDMKVLSGIKGTNAQLELTKKRSFYNELQRQYDGTAQDIARLEAKIKNRKRNR